MTLPRTNYPKQGLPAPPGVHIEFVPGIGEANRELEGVINPIDGGTDLRVTAFAGSGIASPADIAALLAAIQSRGTDTADAVRAVRSGVESLLYEAQHPKQRIWYGDADVALPAAALTWMTPVLDVAMFRYIGWYLWNDGQNPITVEAAYWAEDAASFGALPPANGFIGANAGALAIGAAASAYAQRGTMVAGSWDPATWAPLAARYLRFAATSAVGSTGRCCVVGMR